MENQPVYFFTATILDWNPLLKNDGYKQILLDSMSYLVKQNRCKIFGFVIMPNHIHILWQIKSANKKEDVQRDFLKFTGQMIKTDLKENNPGLLQAFYVNLKDRQYQLWKRNSLSIEMFSRVVMEQKLDYIHNNPVQGKWMLSDEPLFYKYSSIRYYEEGNELEYSFITHYMEYYE